MFQIDFSKLKIISYKFFLTWNTDKKQGDLLKNLNFGIFKYIILNNK